MNIHMIVSALAPHSPISVLAVDTNDLQPVGQLDQHDADVLAHGQEPLDQSGLIL